MTRASSPDARLRVLIIDPDEQRGGRLAQDLRARIECTPRWVGRLPLPKQRIAADLIVCDALAADQDSITRLARRCHPRPLIVATGPQSDSQIAMWILAGAADAVVRDPRAIADAALRAAARARREVPNPVSDALTPGSPRSPDRRIKSLVAFLSAAATTDALTGLANRRALDARLQRLWDESLATGADFSVILLDIDNFKVLNDTTGHASGDQVLVHLASSLRSQCRRADLAARLGGDEVALLLPGVESAEAVRVAERIRLDFATRCRSDVSLRPGGGGDSVSYSLSAGASSRRETGALSPAQLMAYADEALYCAKRAGKDCVRAAGAGADTRWTAAS